jgi:hypothetical protein
MLSGPNKHEHVSAARGRCIDVAGRAWGNRSLRAARGLSDKARSIGGIELSEFPHEPFQILRVRGHG